jgi:glutamate synthase (NADPH/NADH) small chain
LRCAEVEWRAGKPVPLEDKSFTLPADMVLLALGFTGVEPGPLLESLGLEPDKLGRLPGDAGGRLPGQGLYACGDAATGPSLVVRSINNGLRVAENAIADYVR